MDLNWDTDYGGDIGPQAKPMIPEYHLQTAIRDHKRKFLCNFIKLRLTDPKSPLLRTFPGELLPSIKTFYDVLSDGAAEDPGDNYNVTLTTESERLYGDALGCTLGCIEKIESEGFKKALCGKVVGP